MSLVQDGNVPILNVSLNGNFSAIHCEKYYRNIRMRMSADYNDIQTRRATSENTNRLFRDDWVSEAEACQIVARETSEMAARENETLDSWSLFGRQSNSFRLQPNIRGSCYVAPRRSLLAKFLKICTLHLFHKSVLHTETVMSRLIL